MNGIQIYATVLFFLGLLAPLFPHVKRSKEQWAEWIVASALTLPITGRVMGWW